MKTLEEVNFKSHENIMWNLQPAELYEEIIKNGEGALTQDFAIRILTGKYTGRSPQDRFIVCDREVEEEIAWGKINQPIPEEKFNRLQDKIIQYLNERKLYVKDLYAGADPKYRLRVRIVSELAYHGLFSHNMFIRASCTEFDNHESDFTVLAAPNFHADPKTDGTRSEAFVFVSFKKKRILIGGTRYSGEVKKGIFSVLSYLFPKQNVLPMHCSANMSPEGNTAVFFGLSGTGKTTLSSDPDRILIGDDEHGWSPDGVFNIEGGCYAKTYKLSKEGEPLIYAATRAPGAILENVVLNKNREPVFDDDRLTRNTRCSYPIHYIPNVSSNGRGNHPNNIIFLTCDAFGVLPPVSKLTVDEAMYYFISGYTAKVAGTEQDVTDPQATFSACFGAPFMPLHPVVYADLLAEKIRRHRSSVWLINTGWTRGPYGVGSRIELQHTRRILKSVIKGSLEETEYVREPVFGLSIPREMDGIPREILNPRHAWNDTDAYEKKAQELARLFDRNFEKYKEKIDFDFHSAGPDISFN